MDHESCNGYKARYLQVPDQNRSVRTQEALTCGHLAHRLPEELLWIVEIAVIHARVLWHWCDSNLELIKDSSRRIPDMERDRFYERSRVKKVADNYPVVSLCLLRNPTDDLLFCMNLNIVECNTKPRGSSRVPFRDDLLKFGRAVGVYVN